MEQLKYVFSSEYLFQTGTQLPTPTDKIYWILGLVLIAFGIFAWIYKRGKDPLTKELWKRWRGLGFTIGILALVWTGLRFQLIRYLSARAVVWSIFILGIIWAIVILRFYFGKYREQRKEFERQEQKMKYM